MKNDNNSWMVMELLLGPPAAHAASVGAHTGTTATRGLIWGPLGHMLFGLPGHEHPGPSGGAQLFRTTGGFALVSTWAPWSQSKSCWTPCRSGPTVPPGFTGTDSPT